MLTMPILNRSKKGIMRRCNVEITSKNAHKVREGAVLKGFNESDIVINGTSFNDSIYNTKNKEPNSTVNFLRNCNYRAAKKDFLVTTKKYQDSDLYDIYSVKMPPKKVSAGLDNLYGSIILDLKSETPGNKKGRYISLKKLGIDKTITEEKIYKLREIVSNEKDIDRIKDLMQLHGISDLYRTIEYMSNFEFTIIDEATIPEEQFKVVLESFSRLNSRDYKNLRNYYSIAEDNKDVYNKLTTISKILYNRPINLIKKSSDKQKVLVKTPDETKNAA